MAKNQDRGKLEFAERFYLLGVLFMRLTLVIAIFVTALNSDWTSLFASVLTLVMTFLPELIQRQQSIRLPALFQVLTIAFIYSAIFLGEVHGYYTRFWWWDVVLHTGASMAIGFIGFTMLFILYKGKRINANPGIIALFSFLIALGIGAIWEIFEFAVDNIFGLNMQKSGLVDTMWDLIVSAFGALLTALSGYFYLKKRESNAMSWLMRKLHDKNPGLFQRRP